MPNLKDLQNAYYGNDYIQREDEQRLHRSYIRAINGERRSSSAWDKTTRQEALKYRGSNQDGRPGFFSMPTTSKDKSIDLDTPWGPTKAYKGWGDVMITTDQTHYNQQPVGHTYEAIFKALIPQGADRKPILDEFYEHARLPHNSPINSQHITTGAQKNAAAKLFSIQNFAEELRTPSSAKEAMARIKKMSNENGYHPFVGKDAAFLAARAGGKRLQQAVRTQEKDCTFADVDIKYEDKRGLIDHFNKPSSIHSFLSESSVLSAHDPMDRIEWMELLQCSHNEYAPQQGVPNTQSVNRSTSRYQNHHTHRFLPEASVRSAHDHLDGIEQESLPCSHHEHAQQQAVPNTPSINRSASRSQNHHSPASSRSRNHHSPITESRSRSSRTSITANYSPQLKRLRLGN